MTRTERAYFENGSLRGETTFDEYGLPHGIDHNWHENGILASECPYKHGRIDGVAKQWNDRGELLGSFEMHNGTGIYRMWHPNGQLMIEFPSVDGLRHGREIIFDFDGNFLGTTYWINDRKVSKKKYQEACVKDPTLPRYDDDKTIKQMRASSWYFSKSNEPAKLTSKTNKDAKLEKDDFCLRLLKGTAVREALSWLMEHDDSSFRSVGETTNQDESIKFVKRLYQQGAAAVHAVEIDGEGDEPQNTGKLIIELPQNEKKREGLFKACGTIAKRMGFDPEPDVGQQYIFLMLD